MRHSVRIARVGPFPRVSPPVFLSAAGIVLLFVLLGAFFPQQAEEVFGSLQKGITHYLGWYYVLVASFFLGFVLWLLLSRYGDIRLGSPHEEPEYSYRSWFAMLFSAGMGIGLMFWSVAEPMYHYRTPPFGEGGTTRAAEIAMRTTFFHWGLHAWAIYVIVGLAIAYFAFRQKLPLSIRSAFYPLFGERIYGPVGHVIDTLAIFGTLFGVATSLGLGVQQINAGLSYLIGPIPQSIPVQLLLIAIVTGIATTSVMFGLNRGIKRLSHLNVWLALVLASIVLICGPTVFILNSLVETTGRYLQNILLMSFWTETLGTSGWAGSWTLFYWGWWIAWAPFVGMFIARISRGRTIRQFVLGVLFVPTLVTFIWLAIFGGSALYMEIFEKFGIADVAHENISMAFYAVLDKLPLRQLTAGLATIVVVTFFVTSADSGSLVIDMLAAGGELEAPRIQRLFWALLMGVVAAVLLVAGGLQALQTASITTGLLFSVVMVAMCVGLLKAFRSEPITPTVQEREAEAPPKTMGSLEHPRGG